MKRFASIADICEEMGFTRSQMLAYCHHRQCNFVTTTAGGGKFMIDTQKFIKFLDKIGGRVARG